MLLRCLWILLIIPLICGCAIDASLSSLESAAPQEDEGEEVLVCPENYLKVTPSNSFSNFPEFCVMKYEAKAQLNSDQSIVTLGCDGTGTNCGGGIGSNWHLTFPSKPVSSPIGKPWRLIDRAQAIVACQGLNDEGQENYDLIGFQEWQIVADLIQSNQDNWVTDSFGDMVLPNGHSDGNPHAPCDGFIDVVETDCENSGGESKNEERRTHFLYKDDSDSIIWDIAGNLWEWVKDDNAAQILDGSQPNISLIDPVANSNTLFFLHPLLIENSLCSKPSANNYCGFGRLYDGDGGAIYKGGFFSFGVISGIHATHLRRNDTYSSNALGFRCVYRP